jgi:hypothetical protein
MPIDAGSCHSLLQVYMPLHSAFHTTARKKQHVLAQLTQSAYSPRIGRSVQTILNSRLEE